MDITKGFDPRTECPGFRAETSDGTALTSNRLNFAVLLAGLSDNGISGICRAIADDDPFSGTFSLCQDRSQQSREVRCFVSSRRNEGIRVVVIFDHEASHKYLRETGSRPA